MLTKNELKLWLRSRSLRFALHGRPAAPESSRELGSIPWNGFPVYYRVGSSDVGVIHSVLLRGGRKAEYWIPRPIRPKVILDIGGNIGAAAIYFAHAYPQARIYSFEPVEENFTLLERNVSGYGNIHALRCALGPSDATLQLIASPSPHNLGGYSIYQRGATAECPRLSVECRSVSRVLAELGIDAPDLIKIDTEGAEFDILTAIPPPILSQVAWIVGELHGENDFELLAYLSKWFEIGVRKSVDRVLCNFHARNRVRVP